MFLQYIIGCFLKQHQYCLDAALEQCGVQAVTDQPWVLITGMHTSGCLWGKKFTDRATQHLPEARPICSSWSTAEKGRCLRVKPPESNIPSQVGALSHWTPCHMTAITESSVSLLVTQHICIKHLLCVRSCP